MEEGGVLEDQELEGVGREGADTPEDLAVWDWGGEG